jgi:hypothetical protein
MLEMDEAGEGPQPIANRLNAERQRQQRPAVGLDATPTRVGRNGPFGMPSDSP